MRVFTTHLWKEWREHRAVLLGILVAMPVLTAATFVGFASFGAQLANGAAVFTGGAAAMTALALSVELFAGEVTRRTLGFWRRQPGGLAVGGLAKVAMLLLAVSVATVWGGLCFWTACRTLVNAKAASNAWASLASADAYLVPFLALALASWVLLTSTWVARGAAAVGIALLLLGAIGFPGFVLWGDRTAFLRTLVPGAILGTLAAIAFPLALAGLSVVVGRRRSDRPFRAALVCFGVLALGGGAAYAHANARLTRWDDVRPSDPDARAYSIVVGKGGRVAFVTLTREGDNQVARPFAVDFETGSMRAVGPAGTHIEAVADPRIPSLATSGAGLVRRGPGFSLDVTKEKMELLDGATGKSFGEYPYEPLEGRAVELIRDWQRSSTPVRTSDGRKAWASRRFLRDGRGQSSDGGPVWAVETRVERETQDGRVETLVFPTTVSFHVNYAMEGGWRGYLKNRDVFVPADVHSIDDCLPLTIDNKGSGHDRIDARRYLYRRPPIQRGDPWSWRVVDVVARTDESMPGFEPDDMILRIHDGQAFVWRKASAADARSGTLSRIDLASGRRGEVAAADGSVPAALVGVRLVGETPAGLWVLSGSGDAEGGFFLYDPTAHRFSRWTPDGRAPSAWVAAIPDEDTILVTAYEPKGVAWDTVIDRVRIGTGERTRLFPR